MGRGGVGGRRGSSGNPGNPRAGSRAAAGWPHLVGARLARESQSAAKTHRGQARSYRGIDMACRQCAPTPAMKKTLTHANSHLDIWTSKRLLTAPAGGRIFGFTHRDRLRDRPFEAGATCGFPRRCQLLRDVFSTSADRWDVLSGHAFAYLSAGNPCSVFPQGSIPNAGIRICQQSPSS